MVYAYWDSNCKRRSFSNNTFYIYTALVQSYQLFNHCQANTRSFLASALYILNSVKTVKDLTQLILRYTNTRICNRKQDLLVHFFYGNRYCSFFAVFKGIGYKV